MPENKYQATTEILRVSIVTMRMDHNTGSGCPCLVEQFGLLFGTEPLYWLNMRHILLYFVQYNIANEFIYVHFVQFFQKFFFEKSSLPLILLL